MHSQPVENVALPIVATADPVLNVATLTKRALHSHDMDRLLLELARVREARGTLTVDLSGITYATPSGMVWLLAALHGLQRIRKDLAHSEDKGGNSRYVAAAPLMRVIPPPPDQPRSRLHYWLKWMGFYEFLDKKGILCDWERPLELLPSAEERTLKSETLLVLTSLQSSADVSAVVTLVSGQVASLLHRHLGYEARDVANLSILLSEACHNVIDHAGPASYGLVAAQVIRRPKQEPFVMIAVADDGVGIRTSLRQAYPEAVQWTHEEAIRQALRRGVSGVPDADRGLGLWTIVEKMPLYRGTLHLRSGATRLRIKAKDAVEEGIETSVYPSAEDLPGVMICLTLRKRQS